VQAYKLYILDLDGTVYRGDQAIPGAVDTVAELRSRGSQIRFLTNNSGQTRESYVYKLKRMGFNASPEEIYSSATGTAAYLSGNGINPVFAIGEAGLVETLREAGIEVLNGDASGWVNPWPSEGAFAVVVGICRAFSYDLLNGALQQCRKGARLIATNTDATYPVEDGRVIPGAGSIVAAVQTCTGIDPVVIGKPNPYLVELILREAGVSPGEAICVGDRVETDLWAGERAGTATHLVLTGVTKEAPDSQPYSQDLRGLL
jgi:4-nitrophenyl phosphatase